MLKILFCLNCCGQAPRATGRSSRSVSVSKQSEKPINNLNFQNYVTSNNDRKKRIENVQDSLGKHDSQITQVTGLSTASSLDKESVGKSSSVLTDNHVKRVRELENLTDAENNKEIITSDVQSVSSIDTDQRTENSYTRLKLTGLRSPIPDQEKWYRNMTLDTKASSTLPSTTKIGDFARLEYSPVDDLVSLATASRSRMNSEKETTSRVGGTITSTELEFSSGNIGNSSLYIDQQGMESSSISIASQLSSELEKNLTNTLEMANSPQMALFNVTGHSTHQMDTNTDTEMTRTSPEPTGAALTSASQDSLSGVSARSRPISRVKTEYRPASGAALVDSTELLAAEDNSKIMTDSLSRDEMSSSVSMATTTISLTNPTPTPSELSGASSKRRKKLSAKGFLKRFKPVKKNKNPNETDKDNK